MFFFPGSKCLASHPNWPNFADFVSRNFPTFNIRVHRGTVCHCVVSYCVVCVLFPYDFPSCGRLLWHVSLHAAFGMFGYFPALGTSQFTGNSLRGNFQNSGGDDWDDWWLSGGEIVQRPYPARDVKLCIFANLHFYPKKKSRKCRYSYIPVTWIPTGSPIQDSWATCGRNHGRIFAGQNFGALSKRKTPNLASILSGFVEICLLDGVFVGFEADPGQKLQCQFIIGIEQDRQKSRFLTPCQVWHEWWFVWFEWLVWGLGFQLIHDDSLVVAAIWLASFKIQNPAQSCEFDALVWIQNHESLASTPRHEFWTTDYTTLDLTW